MNRKTKKSLEPGLLQQHIVNVCWGMPYTRHRERTSTLVVYGLVILTVFNSHCPNPNYTLEHRAPMAAFLISERDKFPKTLSPKGYLTGICKHTTMPFLLVYSQDMGAGGSSWWSSLYHTGPAGNDCLI